MPRDRWSLHPGGYFIRYRPTGYARTTVEIAVPPKVQIRRDAKGRIISIDFGDGRRTETEYDDSIPAWDPSGNLLAVGYAFKTIRMTRPGAPDLIGHDTGWTYVTRRSARPWRRGFELALVRQDPGWGARFAGWKERYDQWNQEVRGRWDYYRERWDRNTEPPPDTDEAIRDLEDSEHYRDAIDAALRGGTGDRLEWIIDNQERQNRALERAIIVIDTLPVTSTAEGEYVPPYDIALPSHAGSQRLGLSGRGF